MKCSQSLKLRQKLNLRNKLRMFKSRREKTGMESEVETKSITEIVVVKDTGMETKSKTVIEAVR